MVMNESDAQRLAQQLAAEATPEQHRALLEALLSGDVSSIFRNLDPFDVPEAEPDLLPVPDQMRGFRVRLDLKDTKPPVWRRIELPGDLTLSQVHEAIQVAMGWTNSHLHKFRTGSAYNAPAFLTSYDLSEGDQGISEQEVRLDQVLAAKGDRLWYEYDFGDGWEHVLKVEEVLSAPPDAPRCTGGRLACPPEDCGGVWGYAELAAWVRSGHADEHLPEVFGSDAAHAHGWLGPHWHPDQFDIDEVNANLALVAAPQVAVTGELAEIARDLELRGVHVLQTILAQPAAHGSTQVSDAEATELTQRYRAFLDVVDEGVKLTSAGYLPPVVVREVAAQTGIAHDWLRPITNEDRTWPVAVLRETARSLGLVSVRKGRLAPTAAARRLRDDPQALLAHIISRLPLGKDQFDRHAGWMTLAVAATEAPDGDWPEEVGTLLALIGWRLEGNPMLMPSAECPTSDVLQVLGGVLGMRIDRSINPAIAAVARSAIRADV